MDAKTYEQFPPHLVAPCLAINIAIYAIGAYLLSRLGLLYMALYLTFCLCLEIRLLACHCPNCYYYGHLCAFAKGKISSWFFKKGSPDQFAAKEISWKTMIPDFLVSLIPIGIGIYLLIRNFSILILALILLIFALAMPITGLIRTKIACKHCKQKTLTCPAEKLFAKKPEATTN